MNKYVNCVIFKSDISDHPHQFIIYMSRKDLCFIFWKGKNVNSTIYGSD